MLRHCPVNELNIALVGMPGCGKTTVGQRLAARLGRVFFDLDAEIELSAGMTVSEIFGRHGETYFRQMETECLTRLLRKTQTVISTGGGAVIHNSGLLTDNAIVVYLRRDPELVLSSLDDDSRPLLRDKNRWFELYTQRHVLYEQCACLTVDNNAEPDDAADCIIRELNGI